MMTNLRLYGDDARTVWSKSEMPWKCYEPSDVSIPSSWAMSRPVIPKDAGSAHVQLHVAKQQDSVFPRASLKLLGCILESSSHTCSKNNKSPRSTRANYFKLRSAPLATAWRGNKQQQTARTTQRTNQSNSSRKTQKSKEANAHYQTNRHRKKDNNNRQIGTAITKGTAATTKWQRRRRARFELGSGIRRPSKVEMQMFKSVCAQHSVLNGVAVFLQRASWHPADGILIKELSCCPYCSSKAHRQHGGGKRSRTSWWQGCGYSWSMEALEPSQIKE